jgi:hypothetical protein
MMEMPAQVAVFLHVVNTFWIYIHTFLCKIDLCSRMLGWSTCQLFGWTISVVAVSLGYVLCFMFLHKYLAIKRTRILRDLTLMSFVMITSLAGLPVFFVVSRFLPTEAEADGLINIQTAFSFSGAAVANIFLVLFIRNVFYEGTTVWWMRVLFVVEFIVMPGSPVITLLELDPLIILAPHMIACVAIYTIEAVKAFNLTKHLRATNGDPVSINGTLFIGFSGLFLMVTIFSFVMQEVAFAARDIFEPIGLIDASGCSLFVAIGLVVAMVAVAMLYLGYYIPGWIKALWLSRAKKAT